MKMNPLQMERIAGPEEYSAGRRLEETGSLKIVEQDPATIKYLVADAPPRFVTLSRSLNLYCGCETFTEKGCCRHAVAVSLEAERTNVPEAMLKRIAPQRARDLTDLVTHQMPGEANVRLEVTLALPARPGQDVRLGLRIGDRKLYVIKNIPEFLDAMENRETVSFGRGFTWQPEWMRFADEDERVLRLLRKMLSAREKTDPKPTAAAARLIRIPEGFLRELLDDIGETPLRMMDSDGTMQRIRKIREVRIPMQFFIALGPRGLTVNARMPSDLRPVTSGCEWILTGGNLVRVAPDQQGLVQLIWQSQYEGKCLFEYPVRETELVIGEILPYLKLRGAVELSPELNRRLVRMPLKAEVYLDQDGKSVVGEVRFRYGAITLNPFGSVDEKITLEKGDSLLLRDAEAEHRVLDILANAGFRVRKENIRLNGSEAVFDFVSEGVRKLQETAEVFLSREFKRIIPRRPTLSGSMRMNGEHLELILEADGEPTDEILELLEALSRRRRYFRLKNGEFLDLSELAKWQETAATLYEAAVRDGNGPDRSLLTLRAYRAVYLSSMLESCGIPIETDESVKKVSETLSGGAIQAVTPRLVSGMSLRDYQKRGYEWMYALDQMHMGGILADDMGLGKTVQVIALLLSAKAPGRTSLVVAPTSLTYNWLSEIHRFAPDLSAAVLSGASVQRAGLIRHVKQHSDLDVLITSYPLIRRDAELMTDYRFRFVILDEAQNIKNSGSVAAAAVKQLQADSRFALTGTPMENGVGELWSIFDFILPGYLPGYNAFLRRYQDGENAEDLLRRIRPFLTRRLKQDVLEELPDKVEIKLTAQMTQEQEQIYHAALERLRPRVGQILEEKGMGQGRIEVLSAITELRQICCHPALVMNEYQGGSGKEELLMEILPEMISNGRRILLFSQFTSMLKILRSRLEEEGYTTLYLDGSTPAGERQGLTERFNAGEGQIFLISLRAGGSGLNLTGADLVIHYDPWWNPATEDQATDRAHRIGQQKKVEVIRLVTGESIEEQVVELGQRKKALFDRLITPGESAVSALSEQEIRKLFE